MTISRADSAHSPHLVGEAVDLMSRTIDYVIRLGNGIQPVVRAASQAPPSNEPHRAGAIIYQVGEGKHQVFIGADVEESAMRFWIFGAAPQGRRRPDRITMSRVENAEQVIKHRDSHGQNVHHTRGPDLEKAIFGKDLRYGEVLQPSGADGDAAFAELRTNWHDHMSHLVILEPAILHHGGDAPPDDLITQ